MEHSLEDFFCLKNFPNNFPLLSMKRMGQEIRWQLLSVYEVPGNFNFSGKRGLKRRSGGRASVLI